MINIKTAQTFTNILTNLHESEQHQDRRGRVNITVVECYHCSPSQTQATFDTRYLDTLTDSDAS